MLSRPARFNPKVAVRPFPMQNLKGLHPRSLKNFCLLVRESSPLFLPEQIVPQSVFSKDDPAKCNSMSA